MAEKTKMSGQVFGRLTAIEYDPVIPNKRGRWICQCSCGRKLSIIGNSLRRGTSKSCGCLKMEAVITHGMSNTLIYNSWENMIQRCLNVKNDSHKHYGKRGISVCEEWLSFDQFYKDMGDRPKGMTLDRKDNNKGYYPDNCKWSTPAEQNSNTRRNVYLKYRGISMITRQWEERLNMKQNVLASRIKNGWPIQKAMATI